MFDIIVCLILFCGVSNPFVHGCLLKIFDIEGKPLRKSRRVPGQHGWVDSGTILLTGRSFIWANKLRSGGMPTNCLFQRGWKGEKRSRAGCGVLRNQRCEARTHNAPLRQMSGVLQRKGYEVEWEPHIRTSEGLRKPDLVASMGRLALIIDAHIVGDNVDMMAVLR